MAYLPFQFHRILLESLLQWNLTLSANVYQAMWVSVISNVRRKSGQHYKFGMQFFSCMNCCDFKMIFFFEGYICTSHCNVTP